MSNRDYIDAEGHVTVRVYLSDFDTDMLLEELERRKCARRAIPELVRLLRAEGFEVVEPAYPLSTAAGILDLHAFAAWRAHAAIGAGR